ncbi:hypothetical protein ACLKA7_016592 [Drosophila subpalustris]
MWKLQPLLLLPGDVNDESVVHPDSTSFLALLSQLCHAPCHLQPIQANGSHSGDDNDDDDGGVCQAETLRQTLQ